MVEELQKLHSLQLTVAARNEQTMLTSSIHNNITHGKLPGTMMLFSILNFSDGAT